MARDRSRQPSSMIPLGPPADMASRVMAEMVKYAVNGLSIPVVEEAIGDLTEALKAGAKALTRADWATLDPALQAKALKALSDTTDTMLRLLAFAQGQPDSRPDLGKDYLTYLTDEELVALHRRIEAGEAKR